MGPFLAIKSIFTTLSALSSNGSIGLIAKMAACKKVKSLAF
jgi:hypothetical protein